MCVFRDGKGACSVNLLDLLLILAVAAYAASGYRRGLVAGFVSLAGFVGGAIMGVWLLPYVLEHVAAGTPAATLVALLTVLLPAAVGHALAAGLAWKLRAGLHWGPARWVDGVGGAAANTVAVLLVSWVAASVLVSSASITLSQTIRGSAILGAVQDTMPSQAPSWFSRATGALAAAGFPQVFNPFESEPVNGVPEPSGDNVTSTATAAAADSTVKIEGVAKVDGHRQGQEGSGFVFAAEHVMTNAHVVAGVDSPTVQIGGSGRFYSAKVVLFDPKRDVAVLDVPGLSAPCSASPARPPAATAPSSPATPRTAASTCAPPPSPAASAPTARTSTATAPSPATSTRSVPTSAPATPAARSSPRPAPSTAWSSPARPPTPRRATSSRPTRSPTTPPGARRRPGRLIRGPEPRSSPADRRSPAACTSSPRNRRSGPSCCCRCSR